MSSQQRLSHPPTGPHAAEDIGHLQNPAWYAIMVLGLITGAVGSWAVLVLSPTLGINAAVLAVATVVVGVVMTKMGLGTYSFGKGDTAHDKPSLGID